MRFLPSLVALCSLVAPTAWAQQEEEGMRPPVVTGGQPPMTRDPDQHPDDSKTEAIRNAMDCVMYSRRNRYYPLRAKMSLVTRDPRTGRWRTDKPRYLDPIARWDENRMTFVALTESVSDDGGTDINERPHAVIAVPISAFQAIPAKETHAFRVSLLFRWGGKAVHTMVPVELSRSMSFNFKYELAQPVTVFSKPRDNPHAARLDFTIYFTWDCEQDFREAANTGMTRDEVLRRMKAEMIGWRNLMMAEDKEKEAASADPGSQQAAPPSAEGTPTAPGPPAAPK